MTTTAPPPPKPPHPHGPNYEKAVQLQNLAEELNQIRSRILHLAYRAQQGGIVGQEDGLLLHAAARSVLTIATAKAVAAAHFKHLSFNPSSTAPAS